MRAARLYPWLAAMLLHGALIAGPYSAGLNDPANAFDAPVPGFIGPDGDGAARLPNGSGGFTNARNFVNPIFLGWAADIANYSPAPGVASSWANANLALGPVTGDNTNIVSLGDLSTTQITSGVAPGTLTLHFANPIRNMSGADFVVFENALAATGGVFADLAYVEVSGDGVNFTRFPSASLTSGTVGAFGTINPTNVFNLAGKHINSGGASWGTPFDLDAVGLASVSYVRIVDIPGSGAFHDSAGRPIYDSWLTSGSGGIDIEAIGVISRSVTFDEWQDVRGLTGAARGALVDADRDGLANLCEYAFARVPDRIDRDPTTVEVAAGRLALTFIRDERASDLLYEAQASNDCTNWTTLAQSTAGQPTVAANGFAPVITETSASAIASIGVIRKVRVEDVVPVAAGARRFLRVKVTRIP